MHLCPAAYDYRGLVPYQHQPHRPKLFLLVLMSVATHRVSVPAEKNWTARDLSPDNEVPVIDIIRQEKTGNGTQVTASSRTRSNASSSQTV